jgi:hypothetical protein
MNPKRGLDNDEFHKYLLTPVPHLYPDAANVAGEHMLIKCDSGPCRDNLEMLANLCLRGISLSPAVPTSYSATQEMDQFYGQVRCQKES